MATHPKVRLLTVKDLQAKLREFNPEAIVVLSSDAEGNTFSPWLSYSASDGRVKAEGYRLDVEFAEAEPPSEAAATLCVLFPG